jgi:hypothetical protein
MLEKDKYILVLGSKPNSKIPRIEVSNIYAANGASEVGTYYKKFYPKSKLISIVGRKEFEKNMEVQRRVLDSKPEELISRSGKINITNYNLPNTAKFSFFTNYRALFFQSFFFKKNILDVLIKETYYEKEIMNKIKHMYRCFRYGILTGVSTGFFSILYALKKHPESIILISGIGMSKGTHIYNDNNRYDKRSIVDRKLILSLKKKYLSRLITTDIDFAKNAEIQIWNDETINEK